MLRYAASKKKLLQLPQNIEDKGGDLGPLTELDIYVDQALYKVVHDKFPDDGWISEESPKEARGSRFWIIDPVDGTREIVAGIPEWAVSVGLWEDGKPLYGWLYNAQHNVVWHGGPGIGAWAGSDKVSVKKGNALDSLLVGVSRTDLNKGRVPDIEPRPKGIGSIAYKLGLVGIGDIDATISVTPKNIWDIAGGIPIIFGAGGDVIEFKSGKRMDHLADIHALQEGGLVAGHPDWVQDLRTLYTKAP